MQHLQPDFDAGAEYATLAIVCVFFKNTSPGNVHGFLLSVLIMPVACIPTTWFQSLTLFPMSHITEHITGSRHVNPAETSFLSVPRAAKTSKA